MYHWPPISLQKTQAKMGQIQKYWNFVKQEVEV